MMVRLLNGDLVGTDALVEDLDDTVRTRATPSLRLRRFFARADVATLRASGRDHGAVGPHPFSGGVPHFSGNASRAPPVVS